MVQSPSWESNWFAASQEIPRISRNPKVHYRTHKRPPHPEQASRMWVFLNEVFYREGLLAPRPTPKLEDHPSSAVRDCLFNLFTATLLIRGRIRDRKKNSCENWGYVTFCVLCQLVTKFDIAVSSELLVTETNVYTVGYARTNVADCRTSFVIAFVRSSIHRNICIEGYSVPGPQPRAKLPSNTTI